MDPFHPVPASRQPPRGLSGSGGLLRTTSSSAAPTEMVASSTASARSQARRMAQGATGGAGRSWASGKGHPCQRSRSLPSHTDLRVCAVKALPKRSHRCFEKQGGRKLDGENVERGWAIVGGGGQDTGQQTLPRGPIRLLRCPVGRHLPPSWGRDQTSPEGEGDPARCRTLLLLAAGDPQNQAVWRHFSILRFMPKPNPPLRVPTLDPPTPPRGLPNNKKKEA